MSLIRVSQLSFTHDGAIDRLFDQVSFQIDSDWKLGLVGRNGRGKTTFLQLLLGEFDYQGQITASVDFDYFPFPVADPGRLTAAVVHTIHPNIEAWALDRELSLLAVDLAVLDRPFNTLSQGEQTKVLLAVLFLKENRFLLIDEPTNHLDLAARQQVSAYLNRKKGYIVVSHDRSFLDDCIDHILSINKANIEVQNGNFSTWWHNKAQQDQRELAENAQLKKDIRRLSQAARRTSDWSDRVEQSKIGGDRADESFDRGYIGHQAAKMMKRAKAIEGRQQKAIEEKSRLLKNVESVHALKIHPLTYHTRRLIEIKDVTIQYGDKIVCGPVSLTIEQGDRIALTGRNGSGKSSLIGLILGKPLSYQGQFIRGSQLKISSIPQDVSGLTGSLRAFIADSRVDESLFKAILNKLDFNPDLFDQDLASYSAGQKKKVLIARSLCEQAHLYVWDEPLNYIDVFSRMQIEALLQTFQPTILFVEHDRHFCEQIATRIVELE